MRSPSRIRTTAICHGVPVARATVKVTSASRGFAMTWAKSDASSDSGSSGRTAPSRTSFSTSSRTRCAWYSSFSTCVPIERLASSRRVRARSMIETRQPRKITTSRTPMRTATPTPMRMNARPRVRWPRILGAGGGGREGPLGFEPRRDALPVGALPVEPAAAGAEEVLVLPARGARRDARLDFAFRNRPQFGSAGHAPRLARLEVEVPQHHAELAHAAEAGRDPQQLGLPFRHAHARRSAAVGGQEDRATAPGLCPQIRVWGAERLRLVAGRPQPAREPAEAEV